MAQTTLFRNARLIDGIGEQPQLHSAILVEGERIAAIQTGSAAAPPDAKVIDLQGRTVVPGLIDTHIHATLIDTESLPLFLAAGVTSARDTAGKLDKVLQLKADLAYGKVLGPRLFVLGPGLDGAQQSFPYDGPHGELFDSVPSVDAVPGKISHLLRAGVDGIKLYFTMPPDTAKAIIGYVDKRVPVTAHLGYTHSLDVIQAGIDGLEHVFISPYNEFCALNMRFGHGASMMDPGFWSGLIKGWEDADLHGEDARRWFDAMVQKQVNMGTTLDLLWLAKCGSEAAQRDPDRRFITPKGLASQRSMIAPGDQRPDWDLRPGLFDPSVGAQALEKHQAVTRILHEAGGLVVGGTDCGAISYPPPGFALLREVELLAEAIGTMAALKAVTSVAARYLRQEENIGSVLPGRYADFLVVDGDPLTDTRELRKLTTVYRGGVAYDPQTLLARVPKSSVAYPN